MATIIAVLGSKLGIFSIGMAIPVLLALGKKFIPKYFGSMFSKSLAQGMKNIDSIQDPVRRQLVHNIALDLVKLAEYEVPESGAGAEKYQKVASWLCSMLPFLKGRDKDILEIIESAVNAMKAELGKVE